MGLVELFGVSCETKNKDITGQIFFALLIELNLL